MGRCRVLGSGFVMLVAVCRSLPCGHTSGATRGAQEALTKHLRVTE